MSEIYSYIAGTLHEDDVIIYVMSGIIKLIFSTVNEYIMIMK